MGFILIFLLAGNFLQANIDPDQNNIIGRQSSQSYQKIHDCISLRKSLTGDELKKLVSGNSMIGHTCRTGSLYELYFDPNGEVHFRKSGSNKEYHIGKWWVEDDAIFSQWKSYHRPNKNHLKYYHLLDEVYVPFNVNDGCGPKNSFGRPFMIIKGNIFQNDCSFKK
ncbi:MAG: hypothetical protein Tsb0015_06030 [Simkaniaceae bacterium]